MYKWLAAAAALAVALPLALVLLVTTTSAASQASTTLAGGPSVQALNTIPPAYLTLYLDAAQTCPGLPWAVLAGIGKVESDHGQSDRARRSLRRELRRRRGPDAVRARHLRPVRGQRRPVRPADARTTRRTRSTPPPRCSAPPAPPPAPRRASGRRSSPTTTPRPTSPHVLAWAARYTIPAPSSAAATAIAFAVRQVGKPYQWGATGPDAYDCSGLVYAAYAAAGIRIARTTYQWRQDGPQIPLSQIQPGDLLFSAGSDGTPANPGHVVMYLGGGQIIQAPQTGEDVQIDPLDLAGVVVATRPADLPHHA